MKKLVLIAALAVAPLMVNSVQAADASVDKAIDLLVENTSMIKRPIIEGQLDDNNQRQPILLCGYDETEFETVFNK